MITFNLHPKTMTLTATISWLLIALLACGQSSNISPTQTDAHASFGGRMLLLQEGSRSGQLSVVELNSQAEISQTLWSNLPGSFTDSSYNYYTIDPIVSLDGKYALLPGSLSVMNLETGEYADIPAPDALWDAMRSNKTQLDFQPAFSPDNRYLAYSIRGTEQRSYAQSGLYLLDLSSGNVTTLFEGICAEYQGTICGTVSSPVWLDETTLAFSSFAGEMPPTVTYPGMREIRPNHTTILTVGGSILHEFDQSIGMLIRGQTTIIYSGGEVNWIETADFKQGIISGTPIDANVRIELSPDGRYAYYVEQGTLVELRTGLTTTVTAFSGRVHILWSPDGEYVAAWNEISNELHIASLENGSSELLTDLDEISERGKWWSLTWVP